MGDLGIGNGNVPDSRIKASGTEIGYSKNVCVIIKEIIFKTLILHNVINMNNFCLKYAFLKACNYI